MSDKMRGALFNILGDIEGLRILDAFSGTGALSFEAISRGAASSVAIDSDKSAQRTIAENCKQLGLARSVKLIKASVNAWLDTNSSQQFNIVLADPPYHDLQENVIRRLAGAVETGGILVLSWPGAEEDPTLPGLERIDQRSYGDAQLVFYRKIG